MPLELTPQQAQPVAPSMDGHAADWHPAKISDRKLLELSNRLVELRRLGGAFAGVSFSPQATDRLGDMQSRVDP